MVQVLATWNAGAIGDWFTASNWTPAIVPSAGYSVQIGSGTAIVPGGSPAVQGVSILLGGLATGAQVTLEADDASFGPSTGAVNTNTVIHVEGGNAFQSPLNAVFVAKGSTSYDGQIIVEAPGGRLTIVSESDGSTVGNFTFFSAVQNAVMVVEQESVLAFQGQTITNNGLIEVLGGLDIYSSVNFAGSGIVALEDGGQATVWGTVATGQQFDFADETGLLTLKDFHDFKGTLGFINNGGARVDFAGLDVESVAIDSSTQIMTLYAAPNQMGPAIGTIAVQSISPESLEESSFALNADDFVLSSDGAGGTIMTYMPSVSLQQSLPQAIVATAGTMVTFSSILQSSFGNTNPGFTSITLLPTPVFKNQYGTSGSDQGQLIDDGYWDTPNITPQWFLNGHEITTQTTITAAQIGQVTLRVGNQIVNPAQFEALVTTATTGASSETITYNAWSVDPKVVASVQAQGFTGPPTPAAIVASAVSFAQTYGLIPNTNLCNWIADNVAAGAGASMPLPNAYLDPTLNVEGGFWRIAYSAADQVTPVTDWGTLVKPGDIVRMGWFKPESGAESGHTTTVLGAVGADGGITVFDNIDDITVNGNQLEYIGIHSDAEYWHGTDPADITIYRLDPNQQYLIQGTSLGEVIAGSVFNDLIHPGGGADKINVGPGTDEIQDTTANLNGISVTDFTYGDRFDFTDLNPALATLSFKRGVLSVTDGTHGASITLPGSTSQVFVATPDGNGGTFVDRVDAVTLSGVYPSGYVLPDTAGQLTIAAGASIGGTGVKTSAAHASVVTNLGTVLASNTATGITLSDGGSLTNGSATNTTATITGKTGVAVKGFGVVTNYGVIGSITGGAALSFSNASSRLIEYASGQINGSVSGGGSTLELARSTAAGTLSGLGSLIKGFANIQVDMHAVWTLAAGSTIAAGTTLTNAGTLALAGQLANNGTVDNAASGTLDLQGDFGLGNAGMFINDGTLLKSAGTGLSLVRATAGLNSNGKIVVQSGTLELMSSFININGAVSGAGTFTLGSGITILTSKVSTAGLTLTGSGTELMVQEPTLNYAGTFLSQKGTQLYTTVNDRVILTGSATFDNSQVSGFGLLTTMGSTTVHGVSLGQYAQWQNRGALVETGTLSFTSTTSSFYNRTDGVFTLQGHVDIASPTGTNVFTNDGSLIKAGGSTSTISAAFANGGTVEVSSGKLVVTGDVTDRGTFQIDAGQTLEFDGKVASTQTVAFSGGKDKLVVTDTQNFGAKLSNFGANDRLDLAGFDTATTTLGFVENKAGTQGTLTVTDATHQMSVILLGQHVASAFHTASDGTGGTIITYTPPASSSTLVAQH